MASQIQWTWFFYEKHHPKIIFKGTHPHTLDPRGAQATVASVSNIAQEKSSSPKGKTWEYFPWCGIYLGRAINKNTKSTYLSVPEEGVENYFNWLRLAQPLQVVSSCFSCTISQPLNDPHILYTIWSIIITIRYSAHIPSYSVKSSSSVKFKKKVHTN